MVPQRRKTKLAFVTPVALWFCPRWRLFFRNCQRAGPIFSKIALISEFFALKALKILSVTLYRNESSKFGIFRDKGTNSHLENKFMRKAQKLIRPWKNKGRHSCPSTTRRTSGPGDATPGPRENPWQAIRM
jgi:hypothetical protein